MDSRDWSNLTLLLIYTALSLGMLLWKRRAKAAYRSRTRASIDAGFTQTLSRHGIEQAQLLQDITRLGRLNRFNRLESRSFQVHRILHAPPDRWFLYLHVANSEPVLTEISEQRAKASINSSTKLFGWRV